MNTKTTILLGVLLLSFLSCDRTADKVTVGTEVSLSIDVGKPLTRTWLGSEPADGSEVPVYWSDGDVVNVNGRLSTPVSVADGEMKTEAEFKVRGVETPYSIVYPASVCGSNAYVEGKIRVELPTVQQYLPASFGNGSAVTCAYVSDASEDIRMTNLCALVKVSLKDDEASVIKKVFIRSEGEDSPIAGTFELDPREATLTAVQGSNEIMLELLSGVQLGPQTKDFYITLPAGEYPDGFSIFFVREDGRRMRCKWLRPNPAEVEGLTLLQSSMVCFKEVEFVPGAKVIESEADWNSFATAVAEGKGLDVWLDNGVACINSDINFESAPASISEFGYTLDGCGHTLTLRTSAPLFGTLKGTVKNLTLEGSLTASEGPQVAPLANVLSGGVVENCINKMSVTFNGASDVALSGLVARAEGGKIVGCVNEGNISQAVQGSEVLYDICCGGLIADASGSLLVENCVNKGELHSELQGKKCRPTNGGFGGVVGRITSGTSEDYVSLISCSNLSTVSLRYSDISAGGSLHSACVGGIVGIAALYEPSGVVSPTTADYQGIYVVIEKCVNSGAVINEAVTDGDSAKLRKQFAGGIAGSVVGDPKNYSLVKDCISEGRVTTHTGTYLRAAFCTACGGVAGVMGYVDIKGCTVDASLGTLQWQSFAVGGIAAYVLTPFNADGCKVYARIEMIKVKNFSDSNASLCTSMVSKVNGKSPDPIPVFSGSSITGCGFGGSMTATILAQYTDPVPSSVQTVNLTIANFEDYILGGNYTGNDITLSGNYYWSGN